MTVVLAPVDSRAATKVGPRVYRKQVLRKGTIHYPVLDAAGRETGETREVVFDDAYMNQLKQSFDAGAYDDVPFILADEKNQHTMAPERFRGWVKGTEVTADGIDALIELSQDAADLIENTGRKLGVSPRIKPVTHIDGRSFPVAINHVLGTLDARMQGPTLGLNPWEPVDLSDPAGDDVLDLSGATYQEDRKMPRSIDLDTFTDEQADAFASWAALNGVDLSAPDDEQTPEPTAEEIAAAEAEETAEAERLAAEEQAAADAADLEPITDADLDALIDAELAALNLSAPDDEQALDLATATNEQIVEADAQAVELARLRFTTAANGYRDAGVPPFLIDLARPVLELGVDDTLDLSTPNGQTVDVQTVVRDMLDSMKGTIDLARESGYGHETQPAEEVEARANDWVAHVTHQTP